MKSLLVLFVTFVGLCSVAEALTTKLYPVADSYVTTLLPNTNFGTLSLGSAFLDSISLANCQLYLKFNISVLPSTTSDLTLVINEESILFEEAVFGPTIRFNLLETAANWTENLITWNNQPNTISTVLTDHDDNTVKADIAPVSSIVFSYVAQSKSLISFKLTGDSPLVLTWMKEASDSLDRPHLLITY
jgi:hypothetical protein